ncbi:protein FATTY ACID EXPORT 3, chloroplastic isoform X2 [Cannabis sativa]|uniref:protein FATTY ACID EXPORT 3, chloroplastic isoform X2 n=1 Tax=Cannabis sativa TaxID=3483 RepID=UPI0011DF1B39|nr:protein FATTY ACID EXPORT 3, chloroplastic isoform X2 [Cannabis sativa]XP_060969265.1 protein FATTY ACID EXPORT 3, chloroplastic isoform X2 [Cannabis sativa]
MSSTMESLSLLNPSCNTGSWLSLKKAAPMALRSSPSSLCFDPLGRAHSCRLFAAPTRGLASASISLHRKGSSTRQLVVFAASHEDSHSEIEVENEKDNIKLGADESQEAWREALASFKEQALKIQSVSQEAYEVYSKKALVILKETSEQLKIQADKAKDDLSEIVKEISEDGKDYLSTAAEQSPEVKEIVETFTSSTDDLSDISKIHDFRVGIPYGLVLSIGGFLGFMVTGSTAAIRFGVILGGSLLALSVISLRSHNKGKQSSLALKGQLVIASILFLREVRLLAQRPSIISVLTAFISGAVGAFYVYRISQDGKQERGSDLGKKAES